MLVPNCAQTGLVPFQPDPGNPWNRDLIMHLFRRLGYGASPQQIELALLEGPAATVDRALNGAVAREPTPDPVWAGWTAEEFDAAGIDLFESYVDRSATMMFNAHEHGVREKMMMFWQGHFVTRFDDYQCPTFYHDYLQILSTYAFGDLKQFVVEITRTPAMLFFLNGFENLRLHPNENYARELFELFTLGAGNGYTQQDIVEASRALTGLNGWTTYCGPVEWTDWSFDSDDKTVFGRTGNFDYIQLIDVLFEERGGRLAEFICRKIYRHFVNPVADESIVAGMAATLQASDYVLLPMLRELFKSAHFFDRSHIGARIKSPMEAQLIWLREGGLGSFESQRDWGLYGMANMGQRLGDPPDVAGWPGDRSWLDSSRLVLRWQLVDGYSWAYFNSDRTVWPNLARTLTDDSRDPAVIAAAFLDYFLPPGSLTEEDYTLATDVFKAEIPENYFTDGIWSLDFEHAAYQCVLLMHHIGRKPEFQLC